MLTNIQLPEKQKICVVVVTYFPEQDFLKKYSSLIREAGSMIFVDNHSDSKTLLEIQNFVSLNKQACLILNENNNGIAAALNQGILRAREQGFEWVLTLDQDTEFEDTILDSLIGIYHHYEERQKIALIGSNFMNKNSNILWCPSLPRNPEWIEKEFVITSGSLHCLKAVEQIGLYQEELFIDEVDIEYCFRARHKGYKVLMSIQPLIRQSVGKAEPCKLFGRTVWTNNCSPLRWYYKIRNHILVFRKYGFSEWKWASHTSNSLFKEFFKMICFEKARGAKLRAILKGLKNGLTGNLRKFEEAAND